MLVMRCPAAVLRVEGAGLTGPVMAHGQRPGSLSKVLAPGPAPGPGGGQRGPCSEASEQPPACSVQDDARQQLSPPHYYTSPEDMDDTCSEYDNVGSDVEQDYDEVLHLNREGEAEAAVYRQHSPEAGAGSQNMAENSCEAQTFTPRPQHSPELCDGPPPDPQVGRRLGAHHSAPTERRAEAGQENRFFFSDGDEVEEVLDGAKFIEDLEEKVRGDTHTHS